VVLLIRVSAEGACLSVKVLESSGHAVLDRAAVAAVEQWRFTPARAEGGAVEAEVEVPIRFRLTE
jgi:protein TonB